MSSSIFMITTTTNSVLPNGIIPLTSIARKKGCIISQGVNGVILTKPGYYKINATVTFTMPAAGEATVILTKNNVALPGITATTHISTATTENATIALTGIVRVFCNEGQVVLSLLNTGLAITEENVAFDVEYLG